MLKTGGGRFIASETNLITAGRDLAVELRSELVDVLVARLFGGERRFWPCLGAGRLVARFDDEHIPDGIAEFVRFPGFEANQSGLAEPAAEI